MQLQFEIDKYFWIRIYLLPLDIKSPTGLRILIKIRLSVVGSVIGILFKKILYVNLSENFQINIFYLQYKKEGNKFITHDHFPSFIITFKSRMRNIR